MSHIEISKEPSWGFSLRSRIEHCLQVQSAGLISPLLLSFFLGFSRFRIEISRLLVAEGFLFRARDSSPLGFRSVPRIREKNLRKQEFFAPVRRVVIIIVTNKRCPRTTASQVSKVLLFSLISSALCVDLKRVYADFTLVLSLSLSLWVCCRRWSLSGYNSKVFPVLFLTFFLVVGIICKNPDGPLLLSSENLIVCDVKVGVFPSRASLFLRGMTISWVTLDDFWHGWDVPAALLPLPFFVLVEHCCAVTISLDFQCA